MVSRLSAALALGLAAGSAQADVVYRWEALTGSPGLPATSGSLTVLESAWSLGGQLSYRAGAGCAPNFEQPGCYGWSGSPVRSISFSTGQAGPGTGFGRNLTSAFGQGYSTIADLVFLSEGGLSGRIESGSVGEFLQMSGSDIWRVDVFGTDFERSPCTVFGACSGATGRWVLDAATVPDGAGQVPEPGVLPLMALASLGMAVGLRRRRVAR